MLLNSFNSECTLAVVLFVLIEVFDICVNVNFKCVLEPQGFKITSKILRFEGVLVFQSMKLILRRKRLEFCNFVVVFAPLFCYSSKSLKLKHILFVLTHLCKRESSHLVQLSMAALACANQLVSNLPTVLFMN